MDRPRKEINRKVMVNRAESLTLDRVRGTLARGPWIRRACILIAREGKAPPPVVLADKGKLPRGRKLPKGPASSRLRCIEIGFRMTSEEHELIDRVSNDAGLPMSTWMREMAIRLAHAIGAGQAHLDPVRGLQLNG